MATGILTVMRRIQSMNVIDVCQKSIDDSLDKMADAQRKQMRDGYDADGEPIGEGQYKSRGYFFFKRHLESYDPKAGEIDLYVTGEFQRKIVANRIGNEIILESTSSKYNDLIGLFGRQIFGLTGEYKRKYVNGGLVPVVAMNLKQATGLKVSSL